MTVIRVFMLAAFACVLVSCQTPTDIANRECWSYLDAGQVKSFDACFDRAYAAAAQARDEDAATSRALLSGFAAGEQAKVDAGRAYYRPINLNPSKARFMNSSKPCAHARLMRDRPARLGAMLPEPALWDASANRLLRAVE
jgi:hypothetical protein